MLLGIDIGNSNLTLGLFSESGELLASFRLVSRREQTSDEYAAALLGLLELQGVPRAELRHVAIASVVARLTTTLVQAARRAFGLEPLVIDAELDVGLVMAVEAPREVGMDRVVNVAAARAEALGQAGHPAGSRAVLKAGAIVIDLGTATKLDCLSPSGEFLGGVIAPGLRVSFEALIARAPRLLDVELTARRVLGRNTVECLQSGAVHGHASLVDGLVAKLRAELAFDCRVIATGGLAPIVVPHATSIERVDPDLTLRGLWLIHRFTATRRGP